MSYCPIIVVPTFTASHIAAQRIRENLNGGGGHRRRDDDDGDEHRYIHPEHECMNCVHIDNGKSALVGGELKYWCKLKRKYCASWFDRSWFENTSFYTAECEEGRIDRERREWEEFKCGLKATLVFLLALLLIVLCVVSAVSYCHARNERREAMEKFVKSDLEEFADIARMGLKPTEFNAEEYREFYRKRGIIRWNW